MTPQRRKAVWAEIGRVCVCVCVSLKVGVLGACSATASIPATVFPDSHSRYCVRHLQHSLWILHIIPCPAKLLEAVWRDVGVWD